jgi:hypothetical protein
MKIKWLKYYLQIPHVNLVVNVFDPCMRIDGLQDYFILYYHCLFSKDNNNDDDSDSSTQNLTHLPDISFIIANVRNIFYDSCHKYSRRYGLTVQIT